MVLLAGRRVTRRGILQGWVVTNAVDGEGMSEVERT
jgi:hypothetical protein